MNNEMRWSEFNRIKRNNPESKIGKRTWSYQKTRNDLRKALNWFGTTDNNTTYEEKMQACMRYIVEKTFSLEPLDERDLRYRKDAVNRLCKEDIERTLNSITDKLRVYACKINSNRVLNPEDLNRYIAGKKLFDYIVKEKHIYNAKFPTLGYHVEHIAKEMGIDLDGVKIH